MSSDTVAITTPIKKHKVVLKASTNGFDQEEIEDAYLNAYTEEERSLTPTKRANRKTVERLVVSVDGKEENLVETVMSMQSRDYAFVIEKINEISSGVNDRKKKSSKETT